VLLVKASCEEWFGEEYFALCPNRNEEEAPEVAALIASRADSPRPIVFGAHR
jgi:hypothetical protein